MSEQHRLREQDVSLPEDSGVPRDSTGATARSGPPASDGLLAGSVKLVHADVRRRRNYPAKSGPLPLTTTETLVEQAITQMDISTPQEIAIKVGVSADARPVREVIRAARRTLALNAEAYAAAHMEAVTAAIADGDPKALAVAVKASQWALERIADGADRVVDSAKQAPTQPSLQIGIAIGGVPQPPALPPAEDTVDAISPELMP